MLRTNRPPSSSQRKLGSTSTPSSLVDPSFRWDDGSGGTIKYHFFGKECVIDRNLTNYSNLNSNLTEQGFSSNYPVIFVNQIHSNQVVVIDDESKIHTINNRPKADGIVTNLKNLIIGVITADCTPIIMFDEKNQIISATHAGWRGAFAGITDNTIAAMVKLGAKIENIQAIIAPTIRQKSYEISQEFYDNFLNQNPENKKFFIAGNRPNHYMFDLPGYVGEKLKNAGIKNIIDNKTDTYSNPEKLFSYRRSAHLGESDCGRNISIIQIS